jgi:hypothetical protein
MLEIRIVIEHCINRSKQPYYISVTLKSINTFSLIFTFRDCALEANVYC